MPMSRRPRSDWLGSSTSPPLITRSNLSSGPMTANAGPPAEASASEAAPVRMWRRDASIVVLPKLIPRPHQRSLESWAIHFLAGDVQRGDAARVADVVERVGVEHQEVGA